MHFFEWFYGLRMLRVMGKCSTSCHLFCTVDYVTFVKLTELTSSCLHFVQWVKCSHAAAQTN